MAAKAEWSIVGVGGLFALLLWHERGDFFRSAEEITAAVTLVPEDASDLACVLPSPAGRYRCAYRTESSTWEPAPEPAEVLQPVMTEARAQYLVPGLFQQASVAAHLSGTAETTRFTARCRLRLVQVLPRYQRRFRQDGPWENAGPTWIAEPIDCAVE